MAIYCNEDKYKILITQKNDNSVNADAMLILFALFEGFNATFNNIQVISRSALMDNLCVLEIFMI
jgi:hypothetical protein